MRLGHYSLEKLKYEILGVLASCLDLKTHQIFFFGSRVLGKGNDRSDIDVGIIGPEEISISTMAKIREGMVDLPTLYSVDVVDFNAVSPEFKNVALRQIETFHEKTDQFCR